ncbi:MAG: hypothetical protein DHS20C01_00470 [marine bacterium B5-7]|nr:MAG: hypothetical protein DHS20C01_00470 [marine bacterium B5-7]
MSNSEFAPTEPDPSAPFGRWLSIVSKLAAGIAALLTLTTLVIVAYGVFKRYVMNTPVTWTDELSGYLVVAIVILGASEALRHGDHINVDLLSSRFTGRTGFWLSIWSLIGVTLFAAALVYSGILMVRFSHDFGIYSQGYLEMPMWIPQSILLGGAILLVVVSLGSVLRLLIKR